MYSRLITFLISVLVLACALVSCASSATDDGAYNRGVAAYREQDFAAARAAWTIAAEGGNHSAQSNLGFLLYEGLGGPEEFQRAVALWRVAATAGHSEAQLHLGRAYWEGLAVSQSNVEAYAWFRCSIATTELPTNKDDGFEQKIAQQARRTLERLLESLSQDELERGESLAKQYIASYAKHSDT